MKKQQPVSENESRLLKMAAVELPKFRKTPSELSSFQDFVLYAIKNMGVMKVMPKEFLGKGLDK
ncbi:MAG: hypothetical protein J5705_02560 [Bacteroidaceae bacterium]|nr:hypothetical protein [Bacteroidaceae bacterium]